VDLLPIAAACGSRIGMRQENQDACWAGEIPSGGGDLSAPRFVAAVADGAGGHAGGARASRVALDEFLRNSAAWAQSTSSRIDSLVTDAVLRANALLWKAGGSSEKPCTTLTAAVVAGNRLVIAHVGDSRAYVVRRDSAVQLTRDDSWAERQVELGRMSAQEAARSPQRSVLTQALGSRAAVDVHIYWHDLKDGDRLVLCTDGAHARLQPQEMASVLRSIVSRHDHPRAACEELLDVALDRDGSDNATAVVAYVGAHQGTAVVRVSRIRMAWWRLRARLRWILVLLLAVAAGVAAFLLWPQGPSPTTGGIPSQGRQEQSSPPPPSGEETLKPTEGAKPTSPAPPPPADREEPPEKPPTVEFQSETRENSHVAPR